MYNLGDEGMRGQVERELYEGETLQWVGKPAPLRIIQKDVPSLLPMMLMLALFLWGFPFFIGFVGGLMSGFWPISVFALIFPLIILAIMSFTIMPPLWSIFTEIRAIYAVTDQRALIVRPGLTGRSVRSYSETDIKFVERRERANGMGDILFAREKRYDRYRRSGRFFGTNTHSVDIGFFGISDVREVELLMLETFKTSSGGKPKRKTSDLEEII